MMHRRGFTLIELMAVVCIIGVLALVAVPRGRAAIAEARAVNLDARVDLMRRVVATLEVTTYDSVSAPEGRVPGLLSGSLTERDMTGQAGVTFEFSGHDRELWLLLHAPDAGAEAALGRLTGLLTRAGMTVRFEGAVLHVALSAGAGAAARPAAQPAAVASAAGTPADPPQSAAAPATAPSAASTPAAGSAPVNVGGSMGGISAPDGYVVGTPFSVDIPDGYPISSVLHAYGVTSCDQITQYQATINGMDPDTGAMVCQMGMFGLS